MKFFHDNELFHKLKAWPSLARTLCGLLREISKKYWPHLNKKHTHY